MLGTAHDDVKVGGDGGGGGQVGVGSTIMLVIYNQILCSSSKTICTFFYLAKLYVPYTSVL